MSRDMLDFTVATESDIPTLRDLAHRIWHACYPGIISMAQIDYMLGRMYAPEAIREELVDGVRWELAWHERKAVGFLSIVSEPESARIKLSKLYLLPEHHGRGFGREMLERAKAVAKSSHARQIYLTVNKQNVRAVRAYQKADFQIEREIVTDIGGGFVMDDFVMTCDV